jgi:hypothetical protein
MKKVKYMLIKDYYSPDGALHRGDVVVEDGKAAENYTRVVSDTGAMFVIPRHILKEIA